MGSRSQEEGHLTEDDTRRGGFERRIISIDDTVIGDIIVGGISIGDTSIDDTKYG